MSVAARPKANSAFAEPSLRKVRPILEREKVEIRAVGVSNLNAALSCHGVTPSERSVGGGYGPTSRPKQTQRKTSRKAWTGGKASHERKRETHAGKTRLMTAQSPGADT
ncbi:hypothetical protein ALC53_01229 [Atta colombica]|uniref:Uncharacterized protein n=1 Tax=Atta colombica TaxID=520822 RepID=A0A195BW26_9HYME|nr:hypothetical protein ALC53_01229 [Atta colombica]